MPTSAGLPPSSNDEKGSSERHSNIGACNTASSPPKHQTQTRPALRNPTPRVVPNVLTTDTPRLDWKDPASRSSHHHLYWRELHQSGNDRAQHEVLRKSERAIAVRNPSSKRDLRRWGARRGHSNHPFSTPEPYRFHAKGDGRVNWRTNKIL